MKRYEYRIHLYIHVGKISYQKLGIYNKIKSMKVAVYNKL